MAAIDHAAPAAGTPAVGDPAPPGRGLVLIGLMLTLALAAMDSTVVATAIPSIVRDLGGFALFAWVFSIYLLTQAVSIPVYGKLADLFGRKPVLLAGTLLFLLGSACCGLAWNMVTLIVFRGLQGLGAGAIQPIATTVVGDIYTVEERSRIQGWLASVWGVSAVVGPAIGGFFSQYATWRFIFYINIPIGLAAMVMVNSHLHERVQTRGHRIDVEGAALVMVSTGLLIFGLLEGGVAWEWLSPPSIAIFTTTAVALALFVAVEHRAAEPIIPSWVFRRRLLVGTNLGGAAVGVLLIGLSTFLPTFAQGVLGASPVIAGFALAMMTVGWPISSSFSGRLYLRFGFRDTALLGMFICLLAGVGLSMLSAQTSILTVAALSFVMGVGLGFASTSLIVGVQSVVGWERRGVVTGNAMFTRMLGSAVGAAVLGSIANSTLAGWFSRAPASLRGHLPSNVNAATTVLGGAHDVTGAAARYVEDGLYLAAHRVFIGLAAVGVAGVLVVLLAPRRFRQLD